VTGWKFGGSTVSSNYRHFYITIIIHGSFTASSWFIFRVTFAIEMSGMVQQHILCDCNCHMLILNNLVSTKNRCDDSILIVLMQLCASFDNSGYSYEAVAHWSVLAFSWSSFGISSAIIQQELVVFKNTIIVNPSRGAGESNLL